MVAAPREGTVGAMSDAPDLGRVTDWLVESDEPAVRYRTRSWLIGQGERNSAVRRDRAQVPHGAIISTLLDLPDPAVDPYRKWWGLHWRLVSLADFALPVDTAEVRARLDARDRPRAVVDRESATSRGDPDDRRPRSITRVDRGKRGVRRQPLGHAHDPRTQQPGRQAPRMAMARWRLELRPPIVGLSIILPRELGDRDRAGGVSRRHGRRGGARRRASNGRAAPRTSAFPNAGRTAADRSPNGGVALARVLALRRPRRSAGPARGRPTSARRSARSGRA